MITSVEIENSQGEVLTIDLEDPTNGFILQEIEGLDPVPATIVSSSFGDQDGEQYQSSYREKRNLIFKIGYEPDYAGTTVKSLRNHLYKFFMPKTPANFKFFSEDLPPVRISGYVEDMDAPLFTKDPRAIISIICLLPDFYDPVALELSGATVETSVETPLEYAGSVETGIIFRLLVDRTLSDFTVHHRTPNNSLREMVFAYPLLAGDVVEISSISGNKYATLTRSAETDSVLYGISPTSRWIELFPGTNQIRVSATGAAIPWEIEYTNKFGGL